MHNLTVSLLNINEAELTINILNKLARFADEDWAIQVILVDNGSRQEQIQELSDWVFENKAHFAEVLFITASHNLGANGGRNVALKLALYDRILIMDNDLILPDDTIWLEKLWQHLEEDPQVGLVGPMLVFADLPEVVQGAGIGLTDNGRVGYLNRAELISAIPPTSVEVAASPAACWLIRREAQQQVGLFSEEFYPMQYWDVDFCVRLVLNGWKIICDRSVKIKHLENVTTRNLKDHPYARVSVQHWIKFREKWADVLPQMATISEEDIYWGPIPRVKATIE
ncbi:MAG: glycosyltransferase family 2 protein [Anaerolineae bacterium]|nr:glycosyltransferase family 2 protein [Anaerolineae bacterium]